MRLKFGPARDVVLLVSGLGLLANEAILVPEPRTALLTLAGFMIGVPATVLADRKFVSPAAPTEPEEATPEKPPPP